MLNLIMLLFHVSIVNAEIGKITSIIGNDAFILREGKKISVTSELSLEEKDQIETQTSVVGALIYPSTQMNLSKNTSILLSKIDEGEDADAFSILDFFKGLIRLQVSKDEGQKINQSINAGNVTFGVRGTEFEISSDNLDDVDLDVIEGEVEVSSPDVQTLAPEIVKKNEGFKFSKKERRFERRALKQKFKDGPRFKKREEVIKEWRKRRELRKTRRLNKIEKGRAQNLKQRMQKQNRQKKGK